MTEKLTGALLWAHLQSTMPKFAAGPRRRTIYRRLPVDITPQTTIDEAAETVLRLEAGLEAGSYAHALAKLAEIRAVVEGAVPEPCRPIDRTPSMVFAAPVDMDALRTHAMRRRTAAKAAVLDSVWPRWCAIYPPDILRTVAPPAAPDRVRMAGPLYRSYDPDPLTYDESETYDSKSANTYIRNIRDGMCQATCHEHGWALPGHDTYYNSCRQVKYMGCIEHGDGSMAAKPVLMSCGRLGCQKCFEAAIESGAMRATQRMFAGAVLHRSKMYVESRAAVYTHATGSVKAGTADYELCRTPEGAAKVGKSLCDDFKRLGYVGGLMIYHEWRFTTGLRRNYYAPHFHFVMFGFIDIEQYRRQHSAEIAAGTMADHPVKQMHDETGRVYRVIRTMYRNMDAYVLVRYLLTHAAIRPRTQAVRYWGSCAANKYGTADVLIHARSRYVDVHAVVNPLAEPITRRDRSTGDVDAYEMDSVEMRVADAPADFLDLDVRTIQYGDVESVRPDGLADRIKDVMDNPAIAKSTPGGHTCPHDADGPCDACREHHLATTPDRLRTIVVRITYQIVGF